MLKIKEEGGKKNLNDERKKKLSQTISGGVGKWDGMDSWLNLPIP
jgi:hypothetical protein